MTPEVQKQIEHAKAIADLSLALLLSEPVTITIESDLLKIGFLFLRPLIDRRNTFDIMVERQDQEGEIVLETVSTQYTVSDAVAYALAETLSFRAHHQSERAAAKIRKESENASQGQK